MPVTNNQITLFYGILAVLGSFSVIMTFPKYNMTKTISAIEIYPKKVTWVIMPVTNDQITPITWHIGIIGFLRPLVVIPGNSLLNLIKYTQVSKKAC